MVKLTDAADYDAGETFEDVPSPLSDAGNHDNYYGRRIRTRCVLLSRLDNKIKLRRGQPTSMVLVCHFERISLDLFTPSPGFLILPPCVYCNSRTYGREISKWRPQENNYKPRNIYI
ncbi:unnamed protein product [Protopolystoma xenopodis]|uniref:Uncharacterized protein n=1 Tax=Protopolystoma xenopodis TaxID=117903 RepID=A0A3S5A1K0_9PLAT|nr:unnamed protein product [Protopolystoma xenopodis]